MVSLGLAGRGAGHRAGSARGSDARPSSCSTESVPFSGEGSTKLVSPRRKHRPALYSSPMSSEERKELKLVTTGGGGGSPVKSPREN